MEKETCSVCDLMIDDDEMGGECCNFCYVTICEKCYDETPSVDYYGWICKECEQPPKKETS